MQRVSSTRAPLHLSHSRCRQCKWRSQQSGRRWNRKTFGKTQQQQQKKRQKIEIEKVICLNMSYAVWIHTLVVGNDMFKRASTIFDVIVESDDNLQAKSKKEEEMKQNSNCKWVRVSELLHAGQTQKTCKRHATRCKRVHDYHHDELSSFPAARRLPLSPLQEIKRHQRQQQQHRRRP